MGDRWIDKMVVADLVEAERNAKDHDEVLIGESLDRFGYIEPIVLDERTGRIISGHGRRGRILAAESAGGDPPEGVDVDEQGRWVVPVVRGWSSDDDDDALAAGIALNRGPERGGWNQNMLAEDLARLAATERGLLGVGYGMMDLDDLLARLQEATPAPVAFDPEDHFGEAAHRESTYGEWADGYVDKQVRSMVFDFPLEEYAILAEVATRARAALGVESNAELFALLLRRWAETETPATVEPTPVA